MLRWVHENQHPAPPSREAKLVTAALYNPVDRKLARRLRRKGRLAEAEAAERRIRDRRASVKGKVQIDRS